MAKNDNQDDAGDYLAQVQQNNQKIQSHTGLPWYKGFNSKYKQIPNKTSIILSIFLGIIILGISYIIYAANLNCLILWVILLAVFGLMFYDASKK